VSPALAAALYAGRADILGRMLGLPAAPAATQAGPAVGGEDCPHHAAAGTSRPASPAGDAHGSGHESSEHAAHGVYCTFCLPAGATVALVMPAGMSAAPPPAAPVAPAIAHEGTPAAPDTASHHPRDPPCRLS